MAVEVKLTDQAKKARATLPPMVRGNLDERLETLAGDPAAGKQGTDALDAVSDDGSRFYVEFLYEFNNAGDEMVVNLIDILSY